MKKLVEKAKQIATEAHEGQKRWGGEPYIIHPEAIAKIFEKENYGFDDYAAQIVAWLHDVLEDTTIKPKDLLYSGIPFDLVASIVCLTKFKDQDYVDYIISVKEDRIATKVKIEDIKHNLSTLPGKSKSIKTKYQLALHILEIKPNETHNH